MSGFGPQISPATTFPYADQGLGRASKGLDNLDRECVSIGALSPVILVQPTTFNATIVTSTVSAYIVLPGRVKIPKIVAFCSAISNADGSITFNLVHGTGSYTPSASNVPGNDNSAVPPVAYNANGQPTSTTGATYAAGGGGIASNPSVPGNAMFAADVPLNTTVFPNLTTSTGTGANYGQLLVPSSPDAVWANTALLTLRIGVPIGESITNFSLVAYMSAQPLSASFPASNFPIYATPEPGIDY